MGLPRRGITTLSTVAEMRDIRRRHRDQRLGFVPTMGALHDGHLGLVRAAKKDGDVVVVSIYVNPSQFAAHEDFGTYPRNYADDIEKLKTVDADYVFLPTTEEIYQGRQSNQLEQGAIVHVKGLSHQLEGSVRPHFFLGVATILNKLLNIVQPDAVYMGQKDGQQCVVTRSLVRDMHIPTEVVIVPTAREHDGLAMSSRNVYLNEKERAVAPILYQSLCEAERLFRAGERDVKTLKAAAEELIRTRGTEFTELQYLEFSNLDTLEDMDRIAEDQKVMLSGALKVGKTRIIDNIILG